MAAAVPFVDLTLDSDDELPAATSTQIRAPNTAGPDFTHTTTLPYHSPSPRKSQNGFTNQSHNGILLPGSLPSPIDIPGALPPPKLHAPPTARRKTHLRELSLSPNAVRAAEASVKRRKVAAGAGRQGGTGASSSPATGRAETRILPPGVPHNGRGGIRPPWSAERGGHLSVYDLLHTQARPVAISYSDSEPQFSGVPSTGRTQSGLRAALHSYTEPQKAGVSNAGPGLSIAGPAPKGMKDVLQQVVFPQINLCLERSGGGLDEATKRSIGRQTATKLCDVELQTQLAGNNGKLSDAMRKALIDKCALLVGIYVHKSGNGPKSKPQAPPVARKQTARRQTKQAVLPEPISIPSSSSESDEDVFKDAVERLEPKETTRQKRDSSSPSTSYSIESPAKEAVFDPTPKQSQKAKAYRQGSLDFASHSPAIGKPANTHSPGKRTGGNRVKKQAQVQVRRSGAREAAAKQSLLREIEALRLAGNDANVSRPYLSLSARKDIARGLSIQEQCLTPSEILMLRGRIVHVDFTSEEVQYVRNVIDIWRSKRVGPKPLGQRPMIGDGGAKIYPSLVEMIVKSQKESSGTNEGSRLIKQRSEESLKNFLDDFTNDIGQGYVALGSNFTGRTPGVLRIAPKPREFSTNTKGNTPASISSILRDRELSRRTVGRGHMSTKARILTSMDDTVVREIEFTGCSGDIATITWLPGDKFVCGAITHCDESNQQYNKPGNLALGSVEKSSLRSVSGHRIIRPIVEKGSNALESMRETQDPYLYCSVTATAFHEGSQMVLTGSFDKTVKVWDINADGSGMNHCGTWHHGGVINFVVTSPHHSKIATAADVFSDAIRVYDLNDDDVSNSPFLSYSGSRADEQSAEQLRSRQSWVYYPSTLQWGKAPSVAHLLLAGYSPRSFDVHDEVPKLIEDTGELCLWDTTNGTRVLITSARTQNVFEVVWHPTLPVFVAATSATGEHEDGVRTQLRIFSRTEIGTFSHHKTFDCRAVDINEITLMSNSPSHCYLTASCTDGNTYVWDSAQEEKPIHVLGHGKSIDDQTQDDGETKNDDHERVDSGVKFAAWGRTTDRFFTGSSDGVVKAWNVRAPPGEEHIADLITLSGGVSAGAFSSDHSRLLIGDATGKLNVLRCGDLDEYEDSPPRRRQLPITPHYEALGSTRNGGDDLMEPSPEPTAREMAQKYVDAGQIVIHRDPYVGAVQGENYLDTRLFCRPLHQGGDPRSEPLEEVVRLQEKRYQGKQLVLSTTGFVEPCHKSEQHKANFVKDLHPKQLDLHTAVELEESGVDLAFDIENEYHYEPEVGVLEGAGEDEEDFVDLVDISPRGRDDVFLSATEVQDFYQLQELILQEINMYKALLQVEEAVVHDKQVYKA